MDWSNEVMKQQNSQIFSTIMWEPDKVNIEKSLQIFTA